MSKPTPSDVRLDRTGSHFLTPSVGNHTGGKEEVYGYFFATWRGQPVQFTMSADRYTTADGEWTAWRVYCSEARENDPEANGGRGAYLTDTARSRMSDAGKPVMVEWLDSDAYTESRHDAIKRAILRQLRDDATGYSGTDRTRRLLANYRHEMRDTTAKAIEHAADMTDAAAEARREAADA